MEETHEAALDRLSDAMRGKMRALGSRVRQARQRRQLSLADCASAAGLSLIVMRRIEAGDPGLSLAYYLCLFQFFGITADIDSLCLCRHDRLAPNLNPDPSANSAFSFDLDN